jgi:uncharacterized protein YjbI with pentapeptide repeats
MLMTTQDDLNVLRSGVPHWNVWRARRKRFDLSGVDLSGCDLRRICFRDGNLEGVILRKANLEGANLDGANLAQADLSGANMFGASLVGADLMWSNLSRAELGQADLCCADLQMADLSDVCCDRACFAGANVDQMLIKGASMFGAFFRDLRGRPTGVGQGHSPIMANCSAVHQV